MEHLSLLATTIGLKELAIGSARLGNKIIPEDNQASNYLDRKGHGGWDLPCRSRKSGNKTSIDFGRNTDEKIGMIPSITIGIPHPQITMIRLINCNIFDLVSKGFTYHGTVKIEGKNLM